MVGSLGYYFWNAFETKKWRQVETSYAAMPLCCNAALMAIEDCRLGPHVADNRRIGECVGTLATLVLDDPRDYNLQDVEPHVSHEFL